MIRPWRRGVGWGNSATQGPSARAERGGGGGQGVVIVKIKQKVNWNVAKY